MLESTTDRPGPPRVLPPRAAGFSLLVAVPFALLQFGLWLILSAERDWFHLGLGALTACVVAVLAARLVAQSPPIIDADGRALPCGHFLPEEAPDETYAELARFFG